MATPPGALGGKMTAKCVGVSTAPTLVVPVAVSKVVLSVAVTVCVPAAPNVISNDPRPLTSVTLLGIVAVVSDVVSVKLSESPEAILFDALSATTWTVTFAAIDHVLRDNDLQARRRRGGTARR